MRSCCATRRALLPRLLLQAGGLRRHRRPSHASLRRRGPQELAEVRVLLAARLRDGGGGAPAVARPAAPQGGGGEGPAEVDVPRGVPAAAPGRWGWDAGGLVSDGRAGGGLRAFL